MDPMVDGSKRDPDRFFGETPEWAEKRKAERERQRERQRERRRVERQKTKERAEKKREEKLRRKARRQEVGPSGEGVKILTAVLIVVAILVLAYVVHDCYKMRCEYSRFFIVSPTGAKGAAFLLDKKTGRVWFISYNTTKRVSRDRR